MGQCRMKSRLWVRTLCGCPGNPKGHCSENFTKRRQIYVRSLKIYSPDLRCLHISSDRDGRKEERAVRCSYDGVCLFVFSAIFCFKLELSLYFALSDYVYMGCNNFILNKTIFPLRCLHELLIEYSIHIPVYMLQSIVWLMTQETHAHPTSYVRYSHIIWPETGSRTTTTTTTTQQSNMLLQFHRLSFCF